MEMIDPFRSAVCEVGGSFLNRWMGSAGHRGGLGIKKGSPRRNWTMSSLVPMSSLPSDSLFYPGETSGAASDPVFHNDSEGRSDVVLFHGSASLDSLLVRIRSLEHKVCRNDTRGCPG